MIENNESIPPATASNFSKQPSGILPTIKTVVLVLLIATSAVLLQQVFIRHFGGTLRLALIGVFGCIIPVEHRGYFECVAGVTKLGIKQSMQESRFKGFDGFVSEKTPYSSIKNMTTINNKLAYIFVRKDGTSGIVFDGKEISGAYQEVYTSTPLIDMGDEPAYIAMRNGTKNKNVLVWKGVEFGAEYAGVSVPSVSDGVLAYRAYEQTPDDKFRHVLVVGDTKVETRFASINEYSSSRGHLAYIAKDSGGKSYVVIDAKEYGPYVSARNLRKFADHIVVSVERGSEKLYLFDGKEYPRSTQRSQTAVIQDTLAYFDTDSNLVLGDTKYASAETIGSDWIFSSGDELGYFRKAADGALQMMIGDRAFGEPIRGTILDVIVSTNGKIALNIEQGKTHVGMVFGSDGSILQNMINPFWGSFSGDTWAADLPPVPDGVRIPYSITSKTIVNDKLYFAARESRMDDTYLDKSMYIFRHQ